MKLNTEKLKAKMGPRGGGKLAAKVGCHRQHIHMLANGRCQPSLEMVGKLADALGCRGVDLLSE